jgi:amphi-Trp domain-containing protein
MDLFEFETSETLTREEAAGRLRAIADELERHNELRVKVNGLPITVEVPKQVTFELEIEVEDDESEIEISIGW